MSAKLEEYRSPDGLLHLTVTVASDGDMTIGFRGFPWHTHADTLAVTRNQLEEDAATSFVREILQDRAIIAMLHVDEILQDVWITVEPEKELIHCAAKMNETVFDTDQAML